MPHVWDDGALLFGYEKTRVFFVDAKSGRMICSHGSDNSASTLGSGLPCNEEEFHIYANGSEDLLYVMRTDYEIWYYPPDSRDIVWQVAFADIEAVKRWWPADKGFRSSRQSFIASFIAFLFYCSRQAPSKAKTIPVNVGLLVLDINGDSNFSFFGEHRSPSTEFGDPNPNPNGYLQIWRLLLPN
ncbi:hypothetical protein WN944_000107 [Citrus x changshan-huyou]|uniref:Uncharacterized protein n=1 Tax=Citrus x changshan-huyou TaxID=2935761 RepID=A0AAP0QPZ8_9ROSI